MAILNYSTSIPSEKTIGEIQKMLVRAKADAVLCEYENCVPVRLTFRVTTVHGQLHFRLPANVDGVFKAIQRDSRVPKAKRTKEQAARVAWRIIKDWVAAQLAIIEAEIATLPQVFLPYASTDTGETIYERFEAKGLPMLSYKGDK